MSQRAYLTVTGSLFGVVALMHLARVLNGWEFQMGPWAVPAWVSCLGVLVPGALCVSAFRLLPRST